MSYTKHEFKSGEKLYASQLNEMDEQIKANEEALETKQPKGDYLTEHQKIKTINGQSLVGEGDIVIEGGSSKKSISMLFVGNSLTQDGIAYLPYMLKTYYPEVDFKLYMWYLGGYDLSQQYANFTSNGNADVFSVAENSAAWTNYTRNKTMAQVLSTYTFDLVCMQEYFNLKTEYPDTTDWNNCRDYIVSNYKGGNALEFISLFHAPMRHDDDDIDGIYELTEYGNGIILQTTISQDMIPNGIAVYRALSTELDVLGDKQHLSPDYVHTQEGLPCLMQTYVTLCWLFDRLGINKSIYGSPMRMTTEIYNNIGVPGPNLGSGVIKGTDAQNLLAQEIAIKAYKEGKRFVAENVGKMAKYTFSVTAEPSDATVKLNGVEQSSITILAGSTVNWEVSKDGYYTKIGSEVVNANTNKSITLNAESAVNNADTTAFVNATGIDDTEMITKLDTMVTSLKTEGLWDKIDALYPCVGSTFDQMSYNLKNPSTYRLTTTGTPTVVKDTSYRCSAPVNSDLPSQFPGADFHMMGCSATKTTELENNEKFFAPGPSVGGGYHESDEGGVIMVVTADKINARTRGTAGWAAQVAVEGDELIIASLSSGIVCNGEDMGAVKTGTPSFLGVGQCALKKFSHNSYNGSATDANHITGYYTVRMTGFGKALTIAEMQKYSEILNTFKPVYETA